MQDESTIRSAEVPYVLESYDLGIGYSSKKVLFPDLNLKVRKGEFIAVLGPNGIGKSTLIKTLTGLIVPLHGSVTVRGRPLQEIALSERAKFLSLVLANQAIHGNFSVYELIALGRFPYTSWLGTLSESDRRVIEDAIEFTGVHHLRNAKIYELSDGERQKALIARALVQETELMVLDEPTAFLDVRNRAEVMRLLKKLSSEGNASVLISTHEIELAMRHADSIWLLQENGRFIAATPDQARSENLVEKAFGLDQTGPG